MSIYSEHNFSDETSYEAGFIVQLFFYYVRKNVIEDFFYKFGKLDEKSKSFSEYLAKLYINSILHFMYEYLFFVMKKNTKASLQTIKKAILNQPEQAKTFKRVIECKIEDDKIKKVNKVPLSASQEIKIVIADGISQKLSNADIFANILKSKKFNDYLPNQISRKVKDIRANYKFFENYFNNKK